MDTSSVFKQEKQSPEVVSKSESTTFPLKKLESEYVQSLVVCRLPAAVPSS